MYMTNEEWEQNNQNYLKESYWVLSGAKWRQIQQLRCCALSRQAVEMKEASAKLYTKIGEK